MADLSERSDGQLLLIGALSLGVILVVLALLLNAAVFTQNLASRGGDLSEEADAGGIRSGMEAGVRETIQYATRTESGFSSQETEISNRVPELSDQIGQYAAIDGRYASVTYIGSTEGRRIYRATDGDYNAHTTSDVEGVRAFSVDIDRGTLPTETLGSLSSPLVIQFVPDSGTTWSVAIFRDGSGATFVSVYEGGLTGTRRGFCSDTSGSRTVVDITDATVGGDHCEALDFFDKVTAFDSSNTDAFDVTFDAAGGTEGTYQYVVTPTPTISAITGLPANVEEYVFSTTVTVTYDSPGVTYESDITVVPGGPDV